jgi:hypothetical protein
MDRNRTLCRNNEKKSNPTTHQAANGRPCKHSNIITMNNTNTILSHFKKKVKCYSRILSKKVKIVTFMSYNSYIFHW